MLWPSGRSIAPLADGSILPWGQAGGSTGGRGRNGRSGTNGASDANGQAGTNGFADPNGQAGTNGASDANGQAGTNGASDANGQAGTNGSSGANGQAGGNGSSGHNGPSGADDRPGDRAGSGSTGAPDGGPTPLWPAGPAGPAAAQARPPIGPSARTGPPGHAGPGAIGPAPARRGRWRWLEIVPILLSTLLLIVAVVWQWLRTGHLDAVLLGLGAVGCALLTRHLFAVLALRERADQLAGAVATFRDLAYTDPLTGLANRRGLQEALAGQAAAGQPYVLLSLDLDGFKAVNDRFGHDAGDSVLVEVARRLRTNLRPDDVAARLGGDEFAVLMSTGLTEAQGVADRLTSVLGRSYPHPGGQAVLSVSIGVADGAGAGGGPGVLHRADLALCYAKRRGKNRVEYYDTAYDELLRRRFRLEHDLRGVLDRGELHLAYHPVVTLPWLAPVGAEVLPRWYHPELGNVRTEEFLPLAQECGMGAELSGWMLHQTCRQLSGWLTAGHDVWMSVAVFPRQLQEPEYVLQVADALHEYGIPPHRLVLEITERPAGPGPEELVRRLGALRRTGVRIALDGFGTDGSSLVGLRRLPIDILKVHRSLLGSPEPVDRSGAPLLDLLVRLGDRLGLAVVAEGVSGQAELTTVRAAGCRYAQGQIFGWGVSAERLTELLAAGSVPGQGAQGAG